MTTAYGLQCARFLAQYDVIVDNFATNKRWRPAVHLLTHMHKDHTQGLARKTPTATLRTLVASHTTLSWLQWRHPAWVAPPRLVVAAPDYKWVAPRDDLQVMAIPAWHCPGAVMFIVKVKNGPTVLVTGDYRVVGDEQLRAIAAAAPYDAVLQDGSRTNIRDWPLPPLSQTAATLETLIERALKSTSRKVYVRARWHGVELLLRDVGPVWVSDTFPDADWTRVWLRNQGVTVDRSARVVLTRQAPFVRPNTPDAARPIVIVPSLRWHNCNNDVREEVVQKGHVYYVRLSAHADAAEAELVLRAAKARQVVTCQDHRGAEEGCNVVFSKRRRLQKSAARRVAAAGALDAA